MTTDVDKDKNISFFMGVKNSAARIAGGSALGAVASAPLGVSPVSAFLGAVIGGVIGTATALKLTKKANTAFDVQNFDDQHPETRMLSEEKSEENIKQFGLEPRSYVYGSLSTVAGIALPLATIAAYNVPDEIKELLSKSDTIESSAAPEQTIANENTRATLAGTFDLSELSPL